MPWNEVTRMEKKMQLVGEHASGLYTPTELGTRHGISRKTVYKWLDRYAEEGADGLKERSRAPHSCPHQTPEEITTLIVAARKAHPSWGPKKLVAWLENDDSEKDWPSSSTAGDILKRHGLVKERRRKSRPAHPGRPIVAMAEPNDTWTADFKGEFRMGNGQYCYPLTVSDGATRFLLDCKGRTSTNTIDAKPIFKRCFLEFGLPHQILTDNGTPFSSQAIAGLSRLSVWWIKLGIQHVLIDPGHPEQNGRHERMHRTLKAETAWPPAGNMAAQQRTFNSFRKSYNEERPHEALGQIPPATLYRSSDRPYPAREPSVEYPGHYEVRLVSAAGAFRWKGDGLFVSKVLSGEPVGLEEVDDGIWSLYFGSVLLGRVNDRDGLLR